MIYLDNNATTRPYPEVIEVIARELHDSYANPGSRHELGRKARRTLENARESMAAILGADAEEIVFTSGGTEATNMAIFGMTAGEPGAIALTAGEHPATMEACRSLLPRGWTLEKIPTDQDGLVSTENPAALLSDQTRLLTLILAHNETGVIQKVRPIADACTARGIPFHLDAVQAVGKIDVNFHELGVSSLALGAHKFHGPRGIGALLLKQNVNLVPWQFGGHQEADRRPGTESVALIAGMAKALEIFHAHREQKQQHMRRLRDRLQEQLEQKCPPVVVNGSCQHRLPNTLNISFPGLSGEAMLVSLDLEGVACSLGSTCASGAAEPAPVLVAMGCTPDVYRSAIRFSIGVENTEEEIDQAAQRITAVVQRQREQNASVPSA